MSYSSFAWVPLTVGLTILGLILSYITYQRRGLRPAMMVVAFSLLPVAALMTGAIEMLWKVGVAIGQFGTGFVFSPEKWAGIGLTGLAVALFLAAGGRQRRRVSRRRAAPPGVPAGTRPRAGRPRRRSPLGRGPLTRPPVRCPPMSAHRFPQSAGPRTLRRSHRASPRLSMTT